jgi:hypothetical protein
MDKDRIGARTQQPLDQIGRLEWSELTTNSNLYCSRDFILFLSPKKLQVGILSLKLAPLGKKPLRRFCEPTYEYCLNLIACL